MTIQPPPTPPTLKARRPGAGELMGGAVSVIERSWAKMGLWLLIAAALITLAPLATGQITDDIAFGDAAESFERFGRSVEAIGASGAFDDDMLTADETSALPLDQLDFQALRDGIEQLDLRRVVFSGVLLVVVGALIGFLVNGLFGVLAAHEGVSGAADGESGTAPPPIDGDRIRRAVGANLLAQSITGSLLVGPVIVFAIMFSAGLSSVSDDLVNVADAAVTDVQQFDDEQWRKYLENVPTEPGAPPFSEFDENDFPNAVRVWDRSESDVATATPMIGVSFLALLVWPLTAIFAVFLWIRWSLVLPVVATEDVSIRGALKRSSQLVKGSWWSLLLVYVVMIVGMMIVSGIVGAVVGSPGSTPWSGARFVMGESIDLVSLLIATVGAIVAMSISVAAYLRLSRI